MDDDDRSQSSGEAGDSVFAGAGTVVDVIDSTGFVTGEEIEALRSRTRVCLEHLGASGEVSVRVVGDGEMASLHGRYSNEPGTTDVLTFDYGSGAGRLDTDIVVCLDVATRESSARGHSRLDELTLYVLHGLMHCVGFDDHDEGEYRRMHEAEDAILESMGLGRVFSRSLGDERR